MHFILKNKLLAEIDFYYKFIAIGFIFMIIIFVFANNYFQFFVLIFIIYSLYVIHIFRRHVFNLPMVGQKLSDIEKRIFIEVSRIPNIRIYKVIVTRVDADIVVCIDYFLEQKGDSFIKSYQSSMSGFIKSEFPEIKNIYFNQNI